MTLNKCSFILTQRHHFVNKRKSSSTQIDFYGVGSPSAPDCSRLPQSAPDYPGLVRTDCSRLPQSAPDYPGLVRTDCSQLPRTSPNGLLQTTPENPGLPRTGLDGLLRTAPDYLGLVWTDCSELSQIAPDCPGLLRRFVYFRRFLCV